MLLFWVCTRVQSTDIRMQVLGLILIIWQGFLDGLLEWTMNIVCCFAPVRARHSLCAYCGCFCHVGERRRRRSNENTCNHETEKNGCIIIGRRAFVKRIGVCPTTSVPGCGVGISESAVSWRITDSEDDIATDSQIIHRTIVALEGVALLIASFTTWKRVSALFEEVVR